MEKIFAVFTNRNGAMQFASYLKRLGISAKTINTPRELSASCGISVVFDMRSFDQAKVLIEKYGFGGMVKLYLVSGLSYNKYRRIL